MEGGEGTYLAHSVYSAHWTSPELDGDSTGECTVHGMGGQYIAGHDIVRKLAHLVSVRVTRTFV